MVRPKRVSWLVGTTARRTAELAAVIGVVVMAGAAVLVPPSFVPLIGWDAAALAFLAMTWWRIGRLDGPETSAAIESEDPSRAGADLAVLAAAVASLVAVAYLVVQADTPAELVLHVGVGVVSVVVSWAVIHTIFTLRYTRMYYSPDPWGGVDFHDHDPSPQPRFTDFAYLAFTVGMTFQVSDTELNTAGFRAAVLRQALLSYLFGAVILALAINLVAGVGR